MWRRLVVVAFMMMLPLLGPASAATVDTQATIFIQTLGNQALAVVRSNMAPTQRLQYFRELLDQDFDMPEISRFVLGPYWRVASQDEQHQSAVSSRIGSFISTAGSLRKPATAISS